MIIVLANFKGSVGKTTTALNLATALVEQGATVQLWDLDPQQTDLSELALEVGLSCLTPLPFLLASEIEQIDVDYHIIEVPPREDPAVGIALKLADYAIIPSPPEILMLKGLGRLQEELTEAKLVNKNLVWRVLITKYVKQHLHAKNEITRSKQWNACDTIIRNSPWIFLAQGKGKSLSEYAGRTNAAKDYRALAQEVSSWQRLKN